MTVVEYVNGFVRILNGLRADLMKWMFLYWSGTVAAIIGMGYFGPK